jgi:predicted PurR-regulated permease PerM
MTTAGSDPGRQNAGGPAANDPSEPRFSGSHRPLHGTAELQSSTVAEPAYVAGVVGRAVYPLGLSRRDLQRIFGGLIIAAIGIYFLVLVQGIVPPFVLAFALAALIDPWLQRNEARGRPRWQSILLLYLMCVAAICLISFTIVPAIKNQVEEFSTNSNSYFDVVQTSANKFLANNSHWLKRFGVTQTKVTDIINQNAGPIRAGITTVITGITGFVTGIASHAIWFIIIPISGFFFMRDFPVFRARLIALFPEPYHHQIDAVSNEVVEVFSRYLRGLGKICLLYGLTAGIMFYILGVRYFLFLGLLAGIFYAVPIAGQFVTATVSGAVAYTMDQHRAALLIVVGPNSLGYALCVILCVVVLNNIFDQLVYPRVVGGSVGLHPVTAIFALSAGATLIGVWGMVLAVPLAASIQIILMYTFPKLRKPPPPELIRTGAPPHVLN